MTWWPTRTWSTLLSLSHLLCVRPPQGLAPNFSPPCLAFASDHTEAIKASTVSSPCPLLYTWPSTRFLHHLVPSVISLSSAWNKQMHPSPSHHQATQDITLCLHHHPLKKGFSRAAFMVSPLSYFISLCLASHVTAQLELFFHWSVTAPQCAVTS